jgi:hypothetical protein
MNMLVHGQQLRLTARERQVLHALTGKDPVGVSTRAELRRYAESHLSGSETDARTRQQLKLLLSKYLTAL